MIFLGPDRSNVWNLVPDQQPVPEIGTSLAGGDVTNLDGVLAPLFEAVGRLRLQVLDDEIAASAPDFIEVLDHFLAVGVRDLHPRDEKRGSLERSLDLEGHQGSVADLELEGVDVARPADGPFQRCGDGPTSRA